MYTKSQPGLINAKKFPTHPDYMDADIDGYISDDPSISNKIPESHIKLTFNLKSGRASDQPMTENNDSTMLKGSPDKNYTKQNNQSGKYPNQDQEALKKLLYSKSPKEAANEYFHQSRLQQQQQPLQQHLNSSKNATSGNKHKSYPYPFNMQSGEKENTQAHQSPTRTDNYNPQGSSKSNEYETAYTELAQKLYNQKLIENAQGRDTQLAKAKNPDLLLSIEQAREIQNKKYINKKDQEDHAVKLIKHGQIINERSKVRTEAYLDKEFEECTFTPKTNVNGDRRNMIEFLEDQQKFLANVEIKKKKIMEKVKADQIINEGTHKPELCKGTLKILEKKQQKEKVEDVPVHHRLYKIRKNPMQKQAGQMVEGFENEGDSSQSSEFIGQINKSSEQSVDVQVTFIPNIHKKSKKLKRNDKIDNILYNDAIRRQHKSAEMSRHKKSQMSKVMSNSSKRALATRFIKEFDTVIIEFLEVGKEPKLDYLQVNEFLKRLCFLKDSETIDAPQFTPERILLYDMWYSLYGDKYKGLHRRNLLVFLLAVLGLHYQITKIAAPIMTESPNANTLMRDEENNNDDGELMMRESGSLNGNIDNNNDDNKIKKQEDYEHKVFEPALVYENKQDILHRPRKTLGTFDNLGNIELTSEEVKKIQKIYYIWYLNRLCSFDNIGQIISNRKYEDHTYHPEILESSKQLAQAYRDKILEETADLIKKNKIQCPKDGKLTHADLLVLTKKVAKEKLDQQGELIREEQLKSCTFKPQTLENTQGSKILTGKKKGESNMDEDNNNDEDKHKGNTPSVRNKSFELYALAKQRSAKKDRDRNEIEFEKNSEECTFAPDLTYTKNKKIPTGPTEIYAKNIDKTIDRLRSARTDREQMLIYKERGYPNGTEGYFQFSLSTNSTKKLTSRSLMDNRDPENGQINVKNTFSNSYKSQLSGTNQSQTSIVQQQNKNQGRIAEVNNNNNDSNNNNNNQCADEIQSFSRLIEKGNKTQNQVVGHNLDQQVINNKNNEDEQDYVKYGIEGIEGDLNDESDQADEKVPLLFVDVNLGQGRIERVIVFEGDKSEDLAQKFAEEHGLDSSMKDKLKELLDSQIAGVLSRIDEEINSDIERVEDDYQGSKNEIQEEEDGLE